MTQSAGLVFRCPQCGCQQRRPGRCVQCAELEVHLPAVCAECGGDLWYEYDPNDDFPLCEMCWGIYH
jgi:hypothetical protein